jgi:hypothetical protein
LEAAHFDQIDHHIEIGMRKIKKLAPSKRKNRSTFNNPSKSLICDKSRIFLGSNRNQADSQPQTMTERLEAIALGPSPVSKSTRAQSDPMVAAEVFD